MERIYASLLTALFFLAGATVSPAQTLSLDGEWTLDFWQQGKEPVRGPGQMDGLAYRTVPARVPGNVELDLLRAGLVENPETDSNVYLLEPWETFQWRYSRPFPTPELGADESLELCFEGIDCFADIWLNGRPVGSTDNMLISHAFDITDLLAPAGQENRLEVYLRSSVIEGRQQVTPSLSRTSCSPESIYVRRAPHTYGWDIMPRLVSAGIWRSVTLTVRPKAWIRDTYWYTESIRPDTRDARIYLDYTLVLPVDFRTGSLKAAYRIAKDGETVSEGSFIPDAHAGRIQTLVPQAALWWPRGYGDSPLYDVSLTLTDAAGTVLDEQRKRLGIRTVALDRTDLHTAEAPGRFRFLVNGEPVFIKGSNWTPMDAFHSRDPQHLQDAFAIALDLNCNMLRCWGGNVYEDHPFYDLCDENGILVWQDFSFGCAEYPQDAAFQEAVGREVRQIVRKLRGHPCIALWSGNNENDASTRWSLAAFQVDPNRDIISRVTIPGALFECDPTRPYLPSSPYYSPAVVAAGMDPHSLPEDHLWGPRGYYKDPFYAEATCLFASETGYHGMPCRESLEQMFSPDNVYPWSDPERHVWKDAWLTKSVRESPAYGYVPKRNNLMINQVSILFGAVPQDLDRFIEASQIVQAEALKYFIERFRIAKFAPRTGILWWNIRDGWPIISDAVTDWYNRPKKACAYIRNAQKDICAMIGDDTGGGHPLVVVNDTLEPAEGTVEVTDADSGKRLYKGKYKVGRNGRVELTRLAARPGPGLWIIRYDTPSGRQVNHYLNGTPPFDLDWYLNALKAVR